MSESVSRTWLSGVVSWRKRLSSLGEGEGEAFRALKERSWGAILSSAVLARIIPPTTTSPTKSPIITARVISFLAFMAIV